MTIFYDPPTGRILSSSERDMSKAEVDAMLSLLPTNTRHLPGHAIKDNAYIRDGRVTPIPARPGEFYKWDQSAQNWVFDSDAHLAAISSKRQSLLVQSDWTQLPDVPLETKAAWAEYRQALRDITEQPGYPDDIIWPVAP